MSSSVSSMQHSIQIWNQLTHEIVVSLQYDHVCELSGTECTNLALTHS